MTFTPLTLDTRVSTQSAIYFKTQAPETPFHRHYYVRLHYWVLFIRNGRLDLPLPPCPAAGWARPRVHNPPLNTTVPWKRSLASFFNSENSCLRTWDVIFVGYSLYWVNPSCSQKTCSKLLSIFNLNTMRDTKCSQRVRYIGLFVFPFLLHIVITITIIITSWKSKYE